MLLVKGYIRQILEVQRFRDEFERLLTKYYKDEKNSFSEWIPLGKKSWISRVPIPTGSNVQIKVTARVNYSAKKIFFVGCTSETYKAEALGNWYEYEWGKVVMKIIFEETRNNVVRPTVVIYKYGQSRRAKKFKLLPMTFRDQWFIAALTTCKNQDPNESLSLIDIQVSRLNKKSSTLTR